MRQDLRSVVLQRGFAGHTSLDQLTRAGPDGPVALRIGTTHAADSHGTAQTGIPNRTLMCVFHVIVGTDSTGSWARIPREGGHGFHAIVGTSF